MPREKFLIQTFDKGIISGADQSDIAEGASAWSIDEHCESIPGTVQPRLGDSSYLDSESVVSMQVSAWLTRSDNKRDLIYYNPSGGTIDAISDFHSAKSLSSLSSDPGTGDTVTMDTFNRAVRIGRSLSGTKYTAKYAGYVDHGQFGAAATPTTLRYVDSELKKLTTFPHPCKVVGDTDFQYGIEYQGKKIYKVTNATGALAINSLDFVSLQGICNAQLAQGGSYLYVYDQTDPSFGTLYKVAKSDLSINASYPISGWGTSSGTLTSPGLCTDIEISTAKIWFAIWYGTNGFPSATIPADGHGFLFNYTIASLVDGSSFQPINVSFNTTVVTPTVTQGVLCAVDSSYAFNNSKTPLIKTSEVYAAEIAFLCNITGQFDSATPKDPGNSIVVMNDSTTVAATMASANCRLVKFSTVGYNNGVMIKGNSFRGVVFGGLTTANNTFGFNGSSGSGNTLQISDIAWGTFGGVVSVYIAAAGIGYTVGDVLTLTAGDGTATCEVTDVEAGAVTGVTILTAGSLYTVATTATTVVPVGGVGCMLDFLTLTGGGYQTETDITTNAKSVIGSMTDCSVSIVSVSTDTATVAFMSSVVTEYGRYYTNTVLLSNGVWGSGTAVKRTKLFLGLDTEVSPVGLLLSTKKYYYRPVLRYQDYQGSPLFQSTIPETVTPAAGETSCAVDVFIDSTAINIRVTGVDIFRAESSTTDSNPTTQYRLVQTCELRDGWAVDTDGTWTTRRRFSFYDTGNYGPSYETEYGIPETLPNNTMDYAVSCSGAGYLFVTQAANDELEEISSVVFRSKRNAPDTFDWSNDFCVLPAVPIALHYFKGYLYAFDNSTMYVIDAENLVLVGEYDGCGVSNALAVASNESAMFFANQDNVYMHDGKQPIVISEAINQIGSSLSGVTSHRTWATTSGYTISLCLFPRFNSLVVAYLKGVSANTYAFVFHLKKQTWCYWVMERPAGVTHTHYDTTDIRSIFSDYLGNIYLSVYQGISKICGLTTGKAATWYSKLINLGDNTALKKIYKVMFDGTCDLYIGYNSPTTITTAVTSSSYLAVASTKCTTVQLKALFTNGEILRGITIIFRQMIGLR